MNSEFGRSITSSLFTFLVGKEQKKVIVHSGYLASLSTALDKLINGSMLEGSLRQAELPDVDEDTFVRLCEYAYVCDYAPPSYAERENVSNGAIEPALEVPEPTTEHTWSDSNLLPGNEKSKKKQTSNYHSEGFVYAQMAEAEPALESQLEPEPEPVEWAEIVAEKPAIPEPLTNVDEPSDVFTGPALPCKEKSIWTRHLQGRFSDLTAHYKASQDLASRIQKFKLVPVPNFRAGEDFSPVFLGHAKLYIVADYYNILPLANLVLHKLANTLARFTLCEDNVRDLVRLVQYVFDNTLPGDALRNLVAAYIVSVLGQIGESAEFRELLTGGGDFVLDFWQLVWG